MKQKLTLDKALKTALKESHLPTKRRRDELGILRATSHLWYDRDRAGGPEALDNRSRPPRVWDRVPVHVRGQIVELTLQALELSSRELAAWFSPFHRRK